MDKAFFILIVIPFILVTGIIIHNFQISTPESRQAAELTKYEITIGMSDYYANSYINTNGILSFHDVLRDVDETFINQSFEVKAHNQ